MQSCCCGARALSVIGPVPAGAPGSDAATDLPQIAEEEIPVSPATS
jgi:hypothetical protein